LLRTAEWINLTFFASMAFMASMGLMPGGKRLPGSRAWSVVGLGAAGAGATFIGVLSSHVLDAESSAFLRDWLPAPILLVAYWQAGRFYVSPNLRLQNWLESIDRAVVRRLRGPERPGRQRWIRRYFETSYLAAYPLVPLALLTLRILDPQSEADRFWVVVLGASYFCYFMLAVLPTLPPRLAAESPDGDERKMTGSGRMNLWVLDRMGIGANTFPSGHVAATTAASLVVADRLPLPGAVFLWVSASIAAGVVFCRYHYLADAVLGVTVAALAWWLIG